MVYIIASDDSQALEILVGSRQKAGAPILSRIQHTDESMGEAMYAVVAEGGKQYRVAVGEMVQVERRDGKVGEQLDLGPVLAIGGEEGMVVDPDRLSSSKVVAEVVLHGKNKKVRVFKKKRRKGYRRTQGHRQAYTQVKILQIQP